MAGLALALAAAAPLMLADERGWLHFPGTPEAFRMQRIERTGNEREWPFAIDRGYLLCAWVLGERTVYFAEPPEREGDEFPRVAVISTDPFDLLILNAGYGDLLAPFEGMEQLIPRMAPFVSTGRRLCDQPRGSDIGPGEL